MKKVICFILCVLMLALSSCGLITCKEPGCSSKSYRDGYCKGHYALQVGTGILKGLEELFN